MAPLTTRSPSVSTPRYIDGDLAWYGCNLAEVADEIGTPAHVACREAVTDSLEAFRAPFEEEGLPLEIRYSVKTNPVPVFQMALDSEGVGFEVCSTHELDLIAGLGVPGERIIVSGLRNGLPQARRAAEEGVEVITLTTPGQLRVASELAGELDHPLPVTLSICPGLKRGRWDLTLNTGAKRAAIGFRPGSEAMFNALDTIRSVEMLDLVGFHMHIGTGISSAAPYRKSLKALEQAIVAAHARGHSITIVDIGGGYGLAAAPVMGTWKIASSLMGPFRPRPGSREGTGILGGVASAVAALFERLADRGIHPSKLIAEPGRAISGPCQLLLLTVTDVVERSPRYRFLICDGGSMAISPMLMTEEHRVMSLREPGEALIRYCVLGNMPSSLDRVSASTILPETRPGDRLAVLDTGAYFVSLNNTFGTTRPPVVWIEGGRAQVARRREEPAELLSRDLLPGDHLPESGGPQ